MRKRKSVGFNYEHMSLRHIHKNSVIKAVTKRGSILFPSPPLSGNICFMTPQVHVHYFYGSFFSVCAPPVRYAPPSYRARVILW